MDDLDLAAAVRSLTDEREITAVIHRRARATDTRDLELSLSCYHPDATEDHEGFDGPIEAYLRTGSPVFERDSPVLVCHHLIANVEIDLAGDEAASSSYFVCHLTVREDGGTRDYINAGRYLDRFERRDGRWLIARRECVYDWSRNDDTSAPWWDAAQSGTGKQSASS